MSCKGRFVFEHRSFNSLCPADAQYVEMQKTIEAVPDIDQLMQEKLQKETKQSTEGAYSCMKEILESRIFDCKY